MMTSRSARSTYVQPSTMKPTCVATCGTWAKVVRSWIANDLSPRSDIRDLALFATLRNGRRRRLVGNSAPLPDSSTLPSSGLCACHSQSTAESHRPCRVRNWLPESLSCSVGLGRRAGVCHVRCRAVDLSRPAFQHTHERCRTWRTSPNEPPRSWKLGPLTCATGVSRSAPNSTLQATTWKSMPPASACSTAAHPVECLASTSWNLHAPIRRRGLGTHTRTPADLPLDEHSHRRTLMRLRRPVST